MKPDWDKLMKEFKDDTGKLIADVDCTAAGQPLCNTHGVRGYPTIKYGDPNALEDYNGGRSYADMKKFAEGLKPSCSPFNMDICSADEKAKIEELLADSDLDAKITAEEKKISDAEANFKAEVEKLQNKYNELNKAKDATVKEVKDGGLGLMKSVKAKKDKGGGKEEL